MNYMYLCNRCKNVYSKESAAPKANLSCPDCCVNMRYLGCSKDEWEQMTDVEKDEIKAGEYFLLGCISGIPKVDEFSKTMGRVRPIQSVIGLLQNGLRISVLSTKYNIPAERIRTINLASSTSVSEQPKNVAGRALTGAVLFGSVGAVVGGMTGLGTKSTTETVYTLCIVYESKNGDLCEIYFDANGITSINTASDFVKAYYAQFPKKEEPGGASVVDL